MSTSSEKKQKSQGGGGQNSASKTTSKSSAPSKKEPASTTSTASTEDNAGKKQEAEGGGGGGIFKPFMVLSQVKTKNVHFQLHYLTRNFQVNLFRRFSQYRRLPQEPPPKDRLEVELNRLNNKIVSKVFSI